MSTRRRGWPAQQFIPSCPDTVLPGMSMHADSRRSHGILKRGWITLFGAIIGALLVFGNEIVVARHLGVPLYGLYALALVVARIGETVSMFGLRSGMMHFLPVYRDQGDAAGAFGTILASLLLPVLLGCACVAGVWFGADVIAARVLDQPESAAYLRLFALPIPLMCLTEVLGVVTRGYGHAEFYVVIRNLTPPVTYMSLLAVLLGAEQEPLAVAQAFGFSQLAASLVGAVIVAWLIGRDRGWTRPRPPWLALYAYSFPIMLNTLLYVLMGASDIIMLGNLRGAADAGVYRACIQLRPAFDMAVLAFNAAAIHLYPILHRDARQAELAQSYRTVILTTAAVTACLFALVWLSRRDILALLGPEFAAGADAMAVLLIGFLVQGCVGGSGIILVVTGHQGQETRAALVGVTLNLLLNWLLIPHYGTVGAALATAVSLIVMNALRIAAVRRHLHLSTLESDLLRAVALGVVVLLLTLLAAHLAGLGDGGGIVSMALRSACAVVLLAIGFHRFGPRLKRLPIADDRVES